MNVNAWTEHDFYVRRSRSSRFIIARLGVDRSHLADVREGRLAYLPSAPTSILFLASHLKVSSY
jgi:hypothetical protein